MPDKKEEEVKKNTPVDEDNEIEATDDEVDEEDEDVEELDADEELEK